MIIKITNNIFMIILDYILLGIILLWALLGFKKGFLESLGSLVGIIIAVLLASRFYPNVSSWLGGNNFTNIIAFVVLFGLSTKIMSLIFWILGKIFKLVTILPFISTFDRFLGFILGLAGGIFTLSIVLYFLSKYPLNDWLTEQMGVSLVAKVLLSIGLIFVPLFPEAIKKLKSII